MKRAKSSAAALSAGVAALTVTLSGCVTVHGETAVVPATSKKEARKVFKEFTEKSNKANSELDAGLNASIEGGALGAIDQASLKARKGARESGDSVPDIKPLKLTDTRFLIPKQAGWPKFFIADAKGDPSGDDRWFYVFQRESADAEWKANYLSVLGSDEVPEFPTDEDGHVEAVPSGGGAGLSVPPGRLSKEYVREMDEETGEFAEGTHTSERREKREGSESQPGVRTEFVDTAAQPPQFVPAGVRTKGGGALVFFASHHHTKQTYAKGYAPKVEDPLVKDMMSGTQPKKSATYSRVSQQAVTVPSARQDDEKITFRSRIHGVTKATSE